jgi:hypothetical protein
LRDSINDLGDGIRTDKCKSYAGNAFGQRMRAFEQHTDLKDLVNPLFVHVTCIPQLGRWAGGNLWRCDLAAGAEIADS